MPWQVRKRLHVGGCRVGGCVSVQPESSWPCQFLSLLRGRHSWGAPSSDQSPRWCFVAQTRSRTWRSLCVHIKGNKTESHSLSQLGQCFSTQYSCCFRTNVPILAGICSVQGVFKNPWPLSLRLQSPTLNFKKNYLHFLLVYNGLALCICVHHAHAWCVCEILWILITKLFTAIANPRKEITFCYDY